MLKNKKRDRLELLRKIVAIISAILVEVNAGVQLFHNLGL